MFSLKLPTNLAERSDARHVAPRLISSARAIAAAMQGPDLTVTASVEHPANVIRPRGLGAFSKAQIRKLAESIKAFGFTAPVLVDRDSTLIAVHARVAAASLSGMTQVPTLRLEGLSEAQKRAYIIADNRLAGCAGWDLELLGDELQVLSEVDLKLDLSVTGLEAAEIDLLIEGVSP